MLRFRSLGSGSTGNATLVEAGSGLRRTRVLIDCGLGIRTLESRLLQAGVDVRQLDAIFITHEHADHIGCAVALVQRLRIPLWMSRGSHAGIGAPELGGLLGIARDGEDIVVGELALRPFTVPHDAREPLQLSCSDGANRLGILTDLGHATAHVLEQLAGCDALLLECNHDPELLARSSYPPFLKQRVGGRFGHLANAAAADVLKAVAHDGLRHVVAAHLSEQNNRPEIARQALADALGCASADIGVALAQTGTDWLNC
jgi:phosphoribosyl 1,2-cyclic phosphodiesterase